jgi:gliding motility-associated-like protein
MTQRYTFLKALMRFAFLFAVICLGTNEAKASHAMGADFEYTCLGPNGSGQMQYRITLRLYRDCSGIPVGNTQAISIEPFGCGGATINMNLAQAPGSGVEVSQLCPSQIAQSECNFSPPSAAPYPGVRVHIYTGVVTLPANCATWRVRHQQSTRNDSDNIVGASGENLSIEAYINNTVNPATNQPFCNNSVVFSSLPVPFFCLGDTVNYNHGAVDPDGDSLVYQIIQPYGTNFAPINYSPGFSAATPITQMPGSSFNFNTQTGQMAFRPGAIEVDVLAVRVTEYRNVNGTWVVVGSTIRDIQVSILNCSVTIPGQQINNTLNADSIGPLSFQACPGTPIQVDILCTDAANHNIILSSTIAATPPAIPGATFLQVGTGDTVIARINWTPGAADTGCYNFIITTRNDDCPINGVFTQSYTICIINKVQVLTADSTFCGNPVQLNATGGTNFSWNPTAGLSNPNITNPTASPTVPTWYRFTSDCGTDSVFLDVDPPFVFDAGPGGTICQNGQIQLNASVDNLYGPYDIQWVPSTGLMDPITGLPNSTILNPVASPQVTTEYKIYFTGVNGCTNLDSATINVAGTGPIVTARAQPTDICPGDTVHLDILSSPLSCGISQSACNGNTQNIQAGTGNLVLPSASPTQYPTVYGHYQKAGRMQMLFPASELLALTGGAGGKIRSIAFNVTQINSNNDTIKNFEIKMGCTQATSLTAWQNGLASVFTPKNIPMGSTLSTGWKTHVLDADYDWDGTSNLVVEICFSNPGGNALNHKVQASTFPQTRLYYSAGNPPQCGNTGVPNSSNTRPNAKFDICISTVAGLPISWTPAAGQNAVLPPTVVSPVSLPQSPVLYHVDVTDTNGCVSSDYVYVNVDTSLKFAAFPADTFFCSPTPVHLTTSVQGTPLPGQSFSYSWQSTPAGPAISGSNPTVNPSVTTTYVVTLLGGACTLRDTIRVQVGNSIPVSFTVDSISCNGANDGILVANPSGGNNPITYNWSVGGPNTNTRSNLGPGVYSVSISDAIGCTGTGNITLTEPQVLTVSLANTPVTCFGQSNGTLTATVGGGTTPYNYTWSPAGLNQPNQSNQAPGLHSVTVTDDHGCIATTSSTITQPPALTLNVFAENATSAGGNDGWAYGVYSGGTVPYTFNWSSPGGTNDTLLGLSAGVYILTVCDANNCCVQDTAFVSDPPPIVLSFTPVQNPCFGDSSGSVSVSATGGIAPYTFVWSNGVTGNSINNLVAGTYSVTATDSAGITVQGSVPITQPTAVTITLDTNNITCFGAFDASVEAIAAGGTPNYTYQWSTGTTANPQVNLAPQTITVTATDNNLCTATASWVITQPAQLLTSINGTTAVSCFGGNNGTALAQTVGGTGTYSYAWSGSAVTTNPGTGFAAGAYTLTVTDQNGCTDTALFTITEPTQIQVTVTPTSASCETSNDGSATSNVTGGAGGYTYNWDGNGGSTTVNGLDNGAHTLVVTDINNCSATTNFNVDTNYVLHISLSADSVNCFNGTDGSATVVALNGQTNYGYAWTPSNQTTATATNLAAGVHTVVVTDNVNCIASGSVTVEQPSDITLTFSHTDPLCLGDANGTATVVANGGTPGYTYDWSATPAANDNSTISNLSAGLYTVTVNDANTCAKTGTVTLTDPAQLQATFINKVEITCANALDGSVEVQVTGGTTPYNYSWSHGPTVPVVSNLAPNTYTVTVTDANSCSTSISTTFNAPPPVSVSVLDVMAVSCPRYTDGQIEVKGTGGTPGSPVDYEYSLDGVTYQTSTIFKDLEAGYYTVYVRDAQQCSFDSMVMVWEPQELSLTIMPNDSTITLGEGLQLAVDLNQYPVSDVNSYTWSPNTGLNCADCPNPFAAPYTHTIYTLTVNYLNNCIANEEVQVYVGNGPDIYVPNAFTPNGDGENDVFLVYGAGLKSVNMKVFNRWGEKIFDSQNQWLGWDGRYKGELVQPGVYTYIVEVTYLNDKKRQKNGTVTLIR